MSEFAEKVRYYYAHSMWSLARVQKARDLGRITEEEYTEIVGK